MKSTGTGEYFVYLVSLVTGKLTNAFVYLKKNNNKNNKHRTYRVPLGHLYFFQLAKGLFFVL